MYTYNTVLKENIKKVVQNQYLIKKIVLHDCFNVNKTALNNTIHTNTCESFLIAFEFTDFEKYFKKLQKHSILSVFLAIIQKTENSKILIQH